MDKNYFEYNGDGRSAVFALGTNEVVLTDPFGECEARVWLHNNHGCIAFDFDTLDQPDLVDACCMAFDVEEIEKRGGRIYLYIFIDAQQSAKVVDALGTLLDRYYMRMK